jgi:hypothetical protein
LSVGEQIANLNLARFIAVFIESQVSPPDVLRPRRAVAAI